MTRDFASIEFDGVSRETSERLVAFVALVEKWNRKINLVSRSTVDSLVQRHVIDSIQVYHAADSGWSTWVDLGSGGGFPGLVVAILAASYNPGARIALVESDARKAVFLREAARVLGVDVLVHNSRIEAMEPLGAGVVSARALAPLTDLCGFALRHGAVGGVAIFPKGATYEEELQFARKQWLFDLETLPSNTDPRSAILKLRNILHV